MALVIPATIHQQIYQHLESTFPNEGGGFLIGRPDEGNQVVVEVRTEDNTFATEEQYHRYLMEQGAFQAAEDYADSQGLTLLGYFHSHPNHPAIPSEFDRVHALPNFLYLIVSVMEGQAADTKVWKLAENREAFLTVELESSA